VAAIRAAAVPAAAMTAPLFFAAPADLRDAVPGCVVPLSGPEGRHAARVRRLRVDEPVLLGDGEGRCADTVVQAVQGEGLLLRVVAVADVPSPSPRFVLVQALAKGDRDEQAVEAATELGVDEVVPWQAARSVVVWRGERADRGRRRWESVVRAASKQSRRLRVPVVTSVVTSAGLAARLRLAALALVLHQDATSPLSGMQLPTSGDVVLVVGPEGGIGADELAALTSAGAVAVRMGDLVLRSSTAGPAALALLSGATRWR